MKSSTSAINRLQQVFTLSARFHELVSLLLIQVTDDMGTTGRPINPFALQIVSYRVRGRYLPSTVLDVIKGHMSRVCCACYETFGDSFSTSNQLGQRQSECLPQCLPPDIIAFLSLRVRKMLTKKSWLKPSLMSFRISSTN